MSEKPESEEFEEEDADDIAPGGDDVDVDHIMRDVESQRRRAPKGGEPAWRRLERVMEDRRTAELLSDFDDYEIGDADDSNGAEYRGADEEMDADEHEEKPQPKKKHKKSH
jgi:ssDNA-binding replication factor A large subunit